MASFDWKVGGIRPAVVIPVAALSATAIYGVLPFIPSSNGETFSDASPHQDGGLRKTDFSAIPSLHRAATFLDRFLRKIGDPLAGPLRECRFEVGENDRVIIEPPRTVRVIGLPQSLKTEAVTPQLLLAVTQGICRLEPGSENRRTERVAKILSQAANFPSESERGSQHHIVKAASWLAESQLQASRSRHLILELQTHWVSIDRTASDEGALTASLKPSDSAALIKFISNLPMSVREAKADTITDLLGSSFGIRQAEDRYRLESGKK